MSNIPDSAIWIGIVIPVVVLIIISGIVVLTMIVPFNQK